jgi:hypothetical protein
MVTLVAGNRPNFIDVIIRISHANKVNNGSVGARCDLAELLLGKQTRRSLCSGKKVSMKE